MNKIVSITSLWSLPFRSFFGSHFRDCTLDLCSFDCLVSCFDCAWMSSQCLYWLLADSISVVMQRVYNYTRQTRFMGENAVGPVKVNTYYCFSLDIELEPCFYEGSFPLPIHWSWYHFERNKISVNQPIRSAFCFGQR